MGEIVLSPNSKMSQAPSRSASANGALSEVELSLYERERELEEARRIARLGTWRWEKATDTLSWSREVFEIYGCDPEQPVPRREQAQRLMPPDSWERINGAIQRAFATGEPYEMDIEVLHTSGEQRWVAARGGVAERSEDGEVLVLRGTVQDITERKRMEIALREREAELREAERINQMGSWNMHVPSGKVWWSPQIFRVFGAEPAETPLTPAVLEGMFLDGSFPRMAEALKRCQTTGEPYEVDSEVMGLDGERRWISARGEVATRDSEGRILTLRGTTQDITARKRTEMALRQREWDLREAQRIAEIGSWRWTAATDERTWSEQMYRIFEREPGTPVPRDEEHRALFVPGKWDEVLAAFQRLAGGEERFSMECQLALPSQTLRWVMLQAEAVRDEQGALTEIRGTMRDMTERRLQVDKLTLSESRYKSLVHASSELVWSVDADGNQMGEVAEWQRFTGQRAEEQKGFGWAAAIHPDDRERTLETWKESVAKGSPFKEQQRLRRADGTYREMDVRAAPVRNADGKIVEWIGMHTDITEQVEAERAARKAHARLEGVLAGMTDGLAVRDREGRYTYFSERAAEILGVEREKVLGQVAWEVFPIPSTSPLYIETQRALATGLPAHFDAFVEAPVNKWLECHYYPSEDGVSVYFRDVTEKKRSEIALRESQSRFRKLYEANLIGICYPDRYGGFSDGNEEFLRIVGYTREDLKAGIVRWDTMTPPEYAELDREHIAEAAEYGSCTPYEKEYVRKDGSRVSILCGYALLENSTDEYVGFISDLTAQKQAEQAVRDREKRFRDLAESLPELVWESGEEGHVTYVNQSFRTFTGYALGQVDGREVFDLVHPEDRERAMTRWRHSMASGAPYENELRMRRIDGSYRSVLSRAVAVRNESGEIERWLGTATDIHDQKLAEEVVRRTEKLAATGRLAASMAHEINNPLESVMNSLYLALLDDGLGAETRAFLETADRELQRVSQVTTQTLRFHRQSRGPAEECLDRVMDSAVSLFESRMATREISLKREYETATALLCCGDEIRQVFANLLSNAIDATNPGGRLRVRIRSAHGWDEGRQPGIRVSLGDTGQGIPEALVSKIFEPFMTTKDATGTGLGLWVSSGIVHKHKGRMSLRSKVGKGTVFSLFFPLDGLS
jgi:PAS domain S-box-containing protein